MIESRLFHCVSYSGSLTKDILGGLGVQKKSSQLDTACHCEGKLSDKIKSKESMRFS